MQAGILNTVYGYKLYHCHHCILWWISATHSCHYFNRQLTEYYYYSIINHAQMRAWKAFGGGKPWFIMVQWERSKKERSDNRIKRHMVSKKVGLQSIVNKVVSLSDKWKSHRPWQSFSSEVPTYTSSLPCPGNLTSWFSSRDIFASSPNK